MGVKDDDETTVDDKPTPDPTPEPKPEDPAPEVHEGCKHLIAAHEDRISALEGTLSTLVTIAPDTTPTKVPWTHRRFGGGR